MKKVIIITGASSGMGKDTALQLIQKSHIVYGGARRKEKMEELVQAGGHALALDVTDQASVAAAVEQVLREQNRIDVLWNNAGYSLTGAMETISYEEAKRQFDVNLFGVAEMSKAVLPTMRKQGTGTIINTSSIGGKMHMPLMQSWYLASKFALEGWSDALRMELEPYGIDVVLIEPGGVATEFMEVMSRDFLDKAKGTAYEEETARIAKGMAKMNTPKNMSPTSVVTDAVLKILDAKKPKTRYVVGKNAKMMLFMRSMLSDRRYDKLMRSMTNSMMKG
ncbi:MAG TPA: short-chain dehydrogenase/reductase [Cytophagales bacterium]|nr:short-chain dehydrogenase/reductase [Cytophagales bacterium]HAA23313.1 short-chain dehydrogenase/reductase [Cytophagales bacterium]HAP60398.1 short-chain dehydrogenase/reductase [Cytophagales bacterium]